MSLVKRSEDEVKAENMLNAKNWNFNGAEYVKIKIINATLTTCIKH